MERRKFAATTSLIAALLALSACGKPDVYALTTDEAYRRLSAAELEPSGDGVFGRLETSVSGNSADEVTWAAGGAHAAYACRLGLKKVDAAHTHVAVNCEGGSPSSGAAAGLEHTMVRNRVIEMVDATLTGRAFNPQLAGGTTAWRWPDDGVDGSYANAAAGAIQMDAQMRNDTGESQTIAERPDVAQQGISPDAGLADDEEAPEQ